MKDPNNQTLCARGMPVTQIRLETSDRFNIRLEAMEHLEWMQEKVAISIKST